MPRGSGASDMKVRLCDRCGKRVMDKYVAIHISDATKVDLDPGVGGAIVRELCDVCAKAFADFWSYAGQPLAGREAKDRWRRAWP